MLNIVDYSKFSSLFQSALKNLIIFNSTHVTDDTYQNLKEMGEVEKENPVSSSQLYIMMDNIEYAKQKILPICQDTGHINIFIQLGEKFPFIPNFSKIINPVIHELTESSHIRPNSVDPFTQINPNTNLGEKMPPIYLEVISESSQIVISVLNKGGGSENWSSLLMLKPSIEIEEIIPMIISHMKKAGGKPCPPTILGIGIGGDAAKCMYNAKKALLRPINTPHPRKEVANLEQKLKDALNKEEIGIMGLGGMSTCLGVNIEYAMRHPATFPVGLVVECYCHRVRSFSITASGNIQYGKLSNTFDFIPQALE